MSRTLLSAWLLAVELQQTITVKKERMIVVVLLILRWNLFETLSAETLVQTQQRSTQKRPAIADIVHEVSTIGLAQEVTRRFMLVA